MADVTTYRRCTMNYHWAGVWLKVGEIRAASDAAVIANPQWWVPLTDTEMSSGKQRQQ